MRLTRPKLAPAPDDLSFDEAAYLDANPDLRQALATGAIPSARTHWDAIGRAEGRPLAAIEPNRPRRDKLLDGLDLPSMDGMEIGALAAPIVTKEQSGGRIRYVDHADTATLRGIFGQSPEIVATMVDVDHVWGEQTLQDCIGPGTKLDYVVNAHVVEHVPDLITWLAEIHAILKPDGRLRMAIPDRRFTFDLRRRCSDLADALDAYLRRARTPLPRAILDHFLNYAEVDLAQAWRGQIDPATLAPHHPPAEALDLARRCFETNAYQDTHCWVFTPFSFARLCAEIAELGLLRLACERLYPTQYMELEFIAALRPADPAHAARTWRDAAVRLAAAAPLLAPLARP